jgi:hypothetical protein
VLLDLLGAPSVLGHFTPALVRVDSVTLSCCLRLLRATPLSLARTSLLLHRAHPRGENGVCRCEHVLPNSDGLQLCSRSESVGRGCSRLGSVSVSSGPVGSEPLRCSGATRISATMQRITCNVQHVSAQPCNAYLATCRSALARIAIIVDLMPIVRLDVAPLLRHSAQCRFTSSQESL